MPLAAMTGYSGMRIHYTDDYYEPDALGQVDLSLLTSGVGVWSFEVSAINARPQIEGENGEAPGGYIIQASNIRDIFTLDLKPLPYLTKADNPAYYRDKRWMGAKHKYLQNIDHPEEIHAAGKVLEIAIMNYSYANNEGFIKQIFELQKLNFSPRWNE